GSAARKQPSRSRRSVSGHGGRGLARALEKRAVRRSRDGFHGRLLRPLLAVDQPPAAPSSAKPSGSSTPTSSLQNLTHSLRPHERRRPSLAGAGRQCPSEGRAGGPGATLTQREPIVCAQARSTIAG